MFSPSMQGDNRRAKPKNRMKNQDAKVTEEFVRWLVNQPLKVQENHVDAMSTEQLSDFFRIGCRIFT